MKKLIAPVLGCLFLAGCFDAEVSLDFQDSETVEITTVTNFDRELFDMMPSGEDPCAGSDHTLTDTYMSCMNSEIMSIDELVQGASVDGASGIDATAGATFERIDADTFRISIDFQSMFDAAAEKSQQGEAAPPPAMLDAFFEGRLFTIKISGPQILETTGMLNDDGTEATIEVPLTALMSPGHDFGEPFNTVVSTKPQCRLFIFC